MLRQKGSELNGYLSLTSFEKARLAAEPFLPVVHAYARREVKRILDHRASTGAPRAQLLDVGGRSSPYTIGLDADVTVLDMPRESEVQQQLFLGFTDSILEGLKARRSNVVGLVLEDMTQCTLPGASFDAVTAVEVIEHVPDDSAFVAQAARVLRDDGFFYLTTPNGEWDRNEGGRNPDHLRHYTRAQLQHLLEQSFDDVQVWYGVRSGKAHYNGVMGISPKHLTRSVKTVGGNLINRWESRGLDHQEHHTLHLFALARTPTR